MKDMVEENTHKYRKNIFQDFHDKKNLSVVDDPLRPASGRPLDTWHLTVLHEGLRVCNYNLGYGFLMASRLKEKVYRPLVRRRLIEKLTVNSPFTAICGNKSTGRARF